MKKESTLSKKLASYSALASAVLIVSNKADAQILYTDATPDETVNAPGNYQLDLNNDGTIDFQFNLIESSTSFGTYVNELVRVVGSGNNSILKDSQSSYAGYYYASALGSGATIGGGAFFANQAILASYFFGITFGNWVNVSGRFLGLKLVVNSNTYYGWARLSVNQACTQLIVSDYALDTVANEAISAGDKCGNYSVYATTVINPSDSAGLCQGSTIATDSLGGFSYQWLLNGNEITGATNFNYTVDSTGNYSVIVTTSYGCVDTATGTQVTVFPPADIPGISQTEDTLISSGASSYQWYLNNVLIPGATDQSYTPPQGGDYTVQITDANGCTSESDPFTFIPIGISNAEDPGISIFEANNMVFVRLNDKSLLDGQIKIWNEQGANIYAAILNTEFFQLDLKHLPAGIYLLNIEKNNKSIARKMVIQ